MMCAAVVGRDERRIFHDAEGRWEGGTCCSYEDLVRAWVDICAGVVWGEVVASGTGVRYCGILWGKEGVWDRDTCRGRKTRFRS